MKLKLDVADPFWWLWAVTLVFIVVTLAGWTPAYAVVVAVSAIQVLVFLVRERTVMAFPTQIRLAYFALTLAGLWATVRLPMCVVLLLGTIMVVFFGRCSIALVLKQMPWNRGRTVRLA